jgi:hypothetical protein
MIAHRLPHDRQFRAAAAGWKPGTLIVEPARGQIQLAILAECKRAVECERADRVGVVQHLLPDVEPRSAQ